MNEQSISNFYIPNISLALKIEKKDLNEQLPNIDQEMMQDNKDHLILTPGITDFWKTNNSYKTIIESYGIAEMNNIELQKSIKTKLEQLYNSNLDYEMQIDSTINENNYLSSKLANSNDIETQVIFLWKFKHYWSKSIATKMNLSEIAVNKILTHNSDFLWKGCKIKIYWQEEKQTE